MQIGAVNALYDYSMCASIRDLAVKALSHADVLLTKTCSAASSVGGTTGWTAWTTENLVSPESKTGT